MNRKLRKGIFLGTLFMGLAATMLVLMPQASPVRAAPPIWWPLLQCESMGGTWPYGPVEVIDGRCKGATLDNVSLCGGPDYVLDYIFNGFGWNADVSSCRLPTPTPTSMRRSGVCKLVSIDDAYLGGYVTAAVKGAPSTLKLKVDGKTYTLPLVPGSVVANGDGTYTAQFYTLDPVTGQALVPAGEYSARCHGANGSKDGGSANTVTIGY